jgi:hypothetical protein
MRANNGERTVLTKPRCDIKPAFIQAARDFYAQMGRPIDEATKQDWINFGVQEDEFKRAADE